jgi:hypothetical protein
MIGEKEKNSGLSNRKNKKNAKLFVREQQQNKSNNNKTR